MKKIKKKLTYKDSGVNIKTADNLISPLKKRSSFTNNRMLSMIGGFASLYHVDIKKYPEPVIVCGTDGVGTKLKIAMKMRKHSSIGQDLLAMCVNDVITSGADPILFLDYLATSRINIKLHQKVLLGIKRACDKINVVLAGGETAEMPGFYQNDEYDIAGFCIGLIDKKKIIDTKRIKQNDIIIGLESNGLHSNGFSLVNKLIEKKLLSLNRKYNGSKIGDTLLRPTKIYSDVIAKIRDRIKGCAHITGGGITENLSRILPNKTSALIKVNSWKVHNIFKIIQDKSALNDHEMLSTFNCGIGMIIIIDKKNKDSITKDLKKMNYKIFEIGSIIKGSQSKVIYE
tara:strand:- start:1005 stop:2033 length:1029 start_codon:yes stop_codon:yes gene_type:complete